MSRPAPDIRVSTPGIRCLFTQASHDGSPGRAGGRQEGAMITNRPGDKHDQTPVEVCIPCGAVTLEGALAIPRGGNGVVVFAHGSGSSRRSPRNQFVARVIRESGNGTLLFDLLTAEEELEDNVTRRLRFDIGLLASRLVAVTRWLGQATGGARSRHRLFRIEYRRRCSAGGSSRGRAADRCRGLAWRPTRSRG